MIYQEQKDEILVSATLLGDKSAYEALVVRWQNRVLSAARQITHSEPLAEDAAQDAFVTAWLKLNTLHDGSKYGAWVSRIAKNRAKNLLIHYREWIDTDLVTAKASNILENMPAPDETELLHENISALSEKVRKVITLYYFEGYSIAEIAQMLAIPRGTVKARLHDGRNKLRKEYGLVNEKVNDTLLDKVMNKIEELKLWRFRKDKTGFDTIWQECLAAVEALPESTQKYHALADTLMHGYWWVKGKANDEVLARIRNAAEQSHNEETMESVVCREMKRVSGEERIQLIRGELIPRMEQQNFIKAQGYLHFWLGRELIEGNKEDGISEYQKTLELLTPADVCYACAQAAIACESADLPEKVLCHATAEEYRNIDGQYRFWSRQGYTRGNNELRYLAQSAVGYYSSLCEGRFFIPDAQVGDSYTSLDGKSHLIFERDGVSVHTPCGVFTDCAVWRSEECRNINYDHTVKTYYKDGVGIVCQELYTPQNRMLTCMLTDYTVVGGSGLLPLAAGNRWSYAFKELKEEFFPHTYHREVTYADGQRATVSEYAIGTRLGYDPDSWEDAILELCEQYYVKNDPQNDNAHIVDVSAALERAEHLARTPLEKAHTKAACTVARQLMEGEPTLHPEPKLHNHWTFFTRWAVRQNDESLRLMWNNNYSLQWYDMDSDWTPGTWESRHPLFYSDIYNILQQAIGTMWSDDWVAGADITRKFVRYGSEVKAHITVSDAGTVTTAAGNFENCLEVKITCKGLAGVPSFMADPKEYYFAPGVGIIKTVHHYGNHAEHCGVYELSSYAGTGEGYFPFEPGMERVYDAVGLTDGYVSQTTYTCEQDEHGTLWLFAARLGYRNL